MKEMIQYKHKEWLALLFNLPIYIFPAWRYFSTGGTFTMLS